MYERLLKKSEELKIVAPPYRDYSRCHKEVKQFINKLIDHVISNLRSEFEVVGDWVTCLVHPNGKKLTVRERKELKVPSHW